MILTQDKGLGTQSSFPAISRGKVQCWEGSNSRPTLCKTWGWMSGWWPQTWGWMSGWWPPDLFHPRQATRHSVHLPSRITGQSTALRRIEPWASAVRVNVRLVTTRPPSALTVLLGSMWCRKVLKQFFKKLIRHFGTAWFAQLNNEWPPTTHPPPLFFFFLSLSFFLTKLILWSRSEYNLTCFSCCQELCLSNYHLPSSFDLIFTKSSFVINDACHSSDSDLGCSKCFAWTFISDLMTGYDRALNMKSRSWTYATGFLENRPNTFRKMLHKWVLVTHMHMAPLKICSWWAHYWIIGSLWKTLLSPYTLWCM